MQMRSWSARSAGAALAALVLIAPFVLARPASAAVAKATPVSGWSNATATVAAGATWRSGTVSVGGTVGRPVWLQQRSGSTWVTIVKGKTNAAHRVSFARKLTTPATYSFRLLVPAVRGWKAAVTLPRVVKVPATKVTAVTGWPSTPQLFAQGGSWPISVGVTGPVGRSVRLQSFVSGVWTTVATTTTNAAHTAAFTRVMSTAGPGSYRISVPAIPFWSSALSASVAVTVSPPGGGVTAPSSISGSFNGSVCIGRCIGTGPKIMMGWSGLVSYTRTGTDGAGNDVYALASATVDWSVQSGVDSVGCVMGGSGSLGGVDALSIFQGNGRLRPVVAGATSGDWVADFVLTGGATNPTLPAATMTVVTGGAGCPIPSVDNDSTLLFGSRSYTALGTNGVQSPTYTGPVVTVAPTHFGGTTTDGVLPPDNVTWTYTFGA